MANCILGIAEFPPMLIVSVASNKLFTAHCITTEWPLLSECCMVSSVIVFNCFKSSSEDIFMGREEGERERETAMGERSISQLPLTFAPTRDWIIRLGVRPDWGLNLQPSCAQTAMQPAEPTARAGWLCFFRKTNCGYKSLFSLETRVSVGEYLV